jgi:transcriptional/translational regulatory protein YebC/TACO1
MEPRKIVTFDAQMSEKKEYTSQASTWGEFKSEIGKSFSDKKVTVKETKVNLENEDAQLPEGDTVLFLFQKESKFGITDEQSATMIDLLEQILNKLNVLDQVKEAMENAKSVDELQEEAGNLLEKMD